MTIYTHLTRIVHARAKQPIPHPTPPSATRAGPSNAAAERASMCPARRCGGYEVADRRTAASMLDIVDHAFCSYEPITATATVPSQVRVG
jgi:hypothetical protein